MSYRDAFLRHAGIDRMTRLRRPWWSARGAMTSTRQKISI